MTAFLTIAAIHLLAVMSPGPDFAMVLQKSLTRSRATALWTCLGIALGISVHVTYCLLGIGLVISQSIVLFSVVKWAGALYLFYVGWHALRAQPSSADVSADERISESPWKALRDGFLCNALNPKATIFFLALFTQVVDTTTPLLTQAGYGLYMTLQTFAWFAFLSWSLSAKPVRKRIGSVQHWVERVMGAALMALGLRLALTSKE